MPTSSAWCSIDRSSALTATINTKTSPTAPAVKTDRRGILANLALLVFSTALALLLSEMALRLMGQGPLYVSPERAQFWKYDPLLGWAHQPGQEGIFETAQFRTFVHINQQGLRDREHTFERTTDRPRLLVLGDSFAWGYGVNEPERFSQRLESSLGVEVINAGVSGYSTDQELLWYQGQGSHYDVDLVILALTGNDIGDNNQDLVSTIYYKPRFVMDGDQLSLKGVPVPRTSPQGLFVYSLSQRSALAFFLVQRYFDLRATASSLRGRANQSAAPVAGGAETGDPFALTIALMRQIRQLATSKKAKFMVVSNDRWWNGPAGSTYRDLVDRLQSEGFLVLDVEARPGFNAQDMVIQGDGHWSSAGHQFVADQIQQFIANHGLLSRSPADINGQSQHVGAP